jgi:hypothetical protein
LTITQSVEISLRACPFTLREYPITASFSKKLELTLGTSYKVDTQEAYFRVMADELQKTLDIQVFYLASQQPHANSNNGVAIYNMQGAIGETETNRIQVVFRYIDKVGTKIYNKRLSKERKRSVAPFQAGAYYRACKRCVKRFRVVFGYLPRPA